MQDKPLVKLLMPFLLGIFLAIEIKSDLHPILFILLSLAFTGIILFTFFPQHSPYFRNQIAYLILSSIFLCSAGMLSVTVNKQIHEKNHLYPYLNKKMWMKVSIDEMPKEGNKSIKTVVRLLEIKDSSGWKPANGSFLLFLAKDSLSEKIAYQDHLYLYSTLSEVSPPKNPHQFNYKQYLSFKKIYVSSYVSSKHWFQSGSGKRFSLFSIAYSLRKKMLTLIESTPLNEKEKAIASALLLGWDEKVDQQTLQSFSTAGITHVLCVSGLHVGIIFMLAGYAFFFMQKTYFLRKIKGVLQLVIIWFFAFIAGLSPPVVRASTMLTFVVLGQLLNKNSNVYNNVAGAAWFILLADPFSLLDVGFQLSFSGLTGIIAIQPVLKKVIHFKYTWLNSIWSLACVSIAAQLATMPFTLYYFHQYSVYFLIANMIVIPFSGLILALAIGIILFSFIPIFKIMLAALFSYCISVVFYVVEWVEKLPFAMISNIHFGLFQAVVMMGMVIYLISHFYVRKKHTVIGFILFCSVFLIYTQVDSFIHSKQKKWIVYHINQKISGIEFVTGNQSCFYSDEYLPEASSEKQFSVNGFRNYNNIQYSNEETYTNPFSDNTIGLYKKNSFFMFGNDKILRLDKEFPITRSSQNMQIDYIILSNNPNIKIRNLVIQFDFSTLIMDATNTQYKINQWKKECDSLQIKYHDVKNSGAFLKEL